MEGQRPKGTFAVWKWEGERWIDVSPEDMEEATGKLGSVPELVTPVERFQSDIDALRKLTECEVPPTLICKATDSMSACYLMGDASGKGFGLAVWSSDEIRWESGNYSYQYWAGSSNYREADNLVTKLEQLASEDSLRGKELFVFTDNAVFEGTFYKGHSSSHKLNPIVLHLRKVVRDWVHSSCDPPRWDSHESAGH